ncbi:hypothetical protein PHMEG_00018305 [Phytophthora megakarya]|uniref:Uncharacterized protein n=1 Tax=Phytophthora megakarya TaxID=4795 RepID=A0A225VUC5_9STRA|nr:hypothetical protein PHMEG_00018305 [Phytophthora megakarya]
MRCWHRTQPNLAQRLNALKRIYERIWMHPLGLFSGLCAPDGVVEMSLSIASVVTMVHRQLNSTQENQQMLRSLGSGRT